MTKNQAIYSFFNGFTLPAYPVTSTPADVTYPYITYENTIGNTGEQVSITVNIWYHTESEKKPNEKAEQISKAIGLGGTQISHDEGSIWIKRGTPWCNSISDENDNAVKGRSLNIILEFL